MIIAEIGSVHEGSLGNAKNLIIEAKKCGAKYVKFQMHISKYETTKNAPNPKYFNNENRYDYFNRIGFSNAEWKDLINFCNKNKIKFLCSTFSLETTKILIKLGVKEIKIPSGEVTNTQLLKHLSTRKIKIYLSTGMSNWKEIDKAVDILKYNRIVLMQCTSMYPCPNNKVGINIISEFRGRYKRKNIEFGFSDHTQGYAASILALSKGAKYFEKHITFSKKMYGSDAKLAMNLNEFKMYCKNIKDANEILKSKIKKEHFKEIKIMKKIFEKSIFSKKKIKKNKKITIKDLIFKKPGDGIKSDLYEKLIGKKSKFNIKPNEKLKFKQFY